MPAAAADNGRSASPFRPQALKLADDGAPSKDSNSAALAHLTLNQDGTRTPRSNRSSLMLDFSASSAAQTAFTALQYMPVPVVVLGPLKTVVLANEAMTRLLCMTSTHGQDEEDCSCAEGVSKLRGQTLSQIGVDLLQNEVPVWVDWEKYIDTIGEESDRKPTHSGDTTPTLKSDSETLFNSTSKPDRTTVHDVAVDVVVSTERCTYPNRKSSKSHHATVAPSLNCSMIISTWWADGAKHYTLTFFSTSPPPAGHTAKPITRSMPKVNKNFDSPGSVSSNSSNSGGRRSQSSVSNNSSALSSPAAYVPNFPPFGPISHNSRTSSASVLQKATRLRGALLNTITLPVYALWRDHSVGIPNRALMKLCTHDTGVYAGGDFLSRFIVWDEHFTRQLEYDEFPIVELIQTQKASSGKRIGLKDPSTGEPHVYDCNCETVLDETTGEFLGGIVILKDVTLYVDSIEAQKNVNQAQFEPMYNEHGALVRWFGTCTDIHEGIQMREAGKRMREQLQRVMEAANLTLCAVDVQGVVQMMKGSASWRNEDEPKDFADIVGQNIFHGRNPDMTIEHHRHYARPLSRILNGQSDDETCEFQQPNGKWFKHRYKPLFRAVRKAGVEGETVLDGAIIVSSDVTTARERELELKEQEKENAKLVANALAAKEASRLKSSFLANMSHEIRTPIAGVIGMAELLRDMNLDAEQAECAENIHRSAGGLLTVINDILDFSKVESGRLDIEEVQFSLSIVIRDVNKMMSFAAYRNNLGYQTEIEPLIGDDLRIMGDPGRLRQVLTNILTNSIKFTSEGHVSLSVKVRKEEEDTVEIEFSVEDTGIGIEEEIRKKLFTPFSQADTSTARRFGGTGLGLTISKNLVELMHGSIGLDSKLGVGTKCVFCIPFKKTEYMTNGSPMVELGAIPDRLQSDISVSISSDDRNGSSSPIAGAGDPRRVDGFRTMAAPPTPHLIQGSRSSGAKSDEETLTEAERAATHILVVEDNAVNQMIALKTIRKLNFAVDACWNGQEAVDWVAAENDEARPKPDIILMDVQMPILDGYKATQKIRRQPDAPQQTRVPIVAMTASAIQGDREKCMKAGMDDYLAKPVKGKLLEKMLVKWAIESRKRRDAVPVYDSSNVTNHAVPNHAIPLRHSETRPPLIHHGASSGDISSSLSSHDGPSAMFKHATLSRTAETEDATRQRRAKLEEHAQYLRNDKLLSATQDPRLVRQHSDEAQQHAASMQPSHALTTANIESYNESMGHENEALQHGGVYDPMRALLEEKVTKKGSDFGSRTADDVQTQRPPLAQSRNKYISQDTITKK
ncbi:MAG: hypothetical protein Q9162_007209 [Coniocarpon cinnabarinum]